MGRSMDLPPPEICQRILALWILLGAPNWKEDDRVRLFELLGEHGQTINDLPPILQAAGVIAAPSKPKDKLYERMWRLFGQLNSDNESIRTAARKKLDTLLGHQNLIWIGPNSLTAILVAYWVDNNELNTIAAPSQSATNEELEFNILDFLLVLYEDYVVLTPVQRIINALWDLHTYVYAEFEV